MSTEQAAATNQATASAERVGRGHAPTARDPANDADAFFEQAWSVIISTQPAAVRAGLAAERCLADELLTRLEYRGLVEVGCADGTLLLPVARRLGLSYVGLDLAAGAVAATRAALAATPEPAVREPAAREPAAREPVTLEPAGGAAEVPGRPPPSNESPSDPATSDAATPDPATPEADMARSSGPGIVVQADICDLAKLDLPLARPTLVAFPFNVFGNLPDPHSALAAAAAVGADVLVLTYDTDPAATEVRTEYYRACRLSGTLSTDEYGVHFVAGPFLSSVYHPDVLTGWLGEHGYQVAVHRYGAVGLAYHGTR